jgi:chaperonin cofactor prefoldin
MAHTNQTAHYHLPQYVGTHIINPLTDTNKAYDDIDTALYEQGQSIAGVVDDIDALKIQNGDSALDTTAQTLSGAVNELKNDADALGLRVTANETDISTLQTQMSTATSNITTLNTSVAGLQTEVASKASATAVDNLTAKVGTGNLATVAQNCVDAINEVNAKIPEGGNVEADDVVYDNTGSGLTATNVQSAIDEVLGKMNSEAIAHYDATGNTATDTTAMIEALKVVFDTLSLSKKTKSFIAVSNTSDGSIVNIYSFMGQLGTFGNLLMANNVFQMESISLVSNWFRRWTGTSPYTDINVISGYTYTLYA